MRVADSYIRRLAPLSAWDVKVVPIRPELDFNARKSCAAENALSPEQGARENPREQTDPKHPELFDLPSAPRDEAGEEKSPAQRPPATRVVVRRRKINSAVNLSPAQVLLRSLDRRPADKIALELFDKMLPRPAPVSGPPANRQERGTSRKVEDDFWPIWLSHASYLRAHSLRFTGGNVADAEDALSEAMLKAAQTFNSDAIRNHRAWFLRLVHNACMDGHRNKRRQSTIVKDITEIDPVSAPAAAAQPSRSPEDLLVAVEQFDTVQRAMKALPGFLAEPLLRYLDEQSDAEIAGSLNVTKEVIRKRRQIAREILRREIR